ncbi:probable E3 ubiquitin-protein ligase ZFP1 isoform X3 [Momordica charantia]|uniref:RING-type E3 ubiquitin transferase n=1 Tax=Momordica charantia TaxID=3673 RepID=A0A6J1CD07_MOMCH|nr:probable E3 ubiquitin-protein ligase ZFP1 isoform X3 [Momordica charantia]
MNSQTRPINKHSLSPITHSLHILFDFWRLSEFAADFLLVVKKPKLVDFYFTHELYDREHWSRDSCTFMDIRKRTLAPSHTTSAIDLELDQQGQGTFSQRSNHSMVTGFRSSTNPEVQHQPEHANGAILYAMSQYSGSMIQRAQDMWVATAGNPCSYLTSPYGNEQFPSPRSGLMGIPSDAYARNSHFIEEVGSPYKRRFAEPVLVNFQGPNSSASSESLNAPFDPMFCHTRSHLARGEYMVQHLQPASNALWLDQRFNCNFEDRGAWNWNHAPAGFPVHGDNAIRGASENSNSGLHRYSEIGGMNCSPSFQHPPSTLIQHPSYRIPLPQPHLQGQRGQNICLNPPVAAVTQRFPLSSAYGIMHQQFLELEPRQTRDLPFNDRRVYNPHETMFRRHLTSRMRVLQEGEAGVPGAQASASASDSNDIGDAYRDMRLDIEHMSYEELLALEEQIGYVGTGLSEEIITSQLKTRISMPSARDANLEEAASRNEETNSCTICLDVIEDGKKIGILDCGHYYHADCLKQWLLIKNVCPVCKSEALTR